MSTGEKSHEVKSEYRKDREIGGALWSGLVREGGREEEVVLSSQLNTKKVYQPQGYQEQRLLGRGNRKSKGPGVGMLAILQDEEGGIVRLEIDGRGM